MAYQSNITINTKLNTSDVDQKISQIQSKLKNLRETGPGGSYSQLAQQYRNQGDEQSAKRIENYSKNLQKQLKGDIEKSLRDQNNELKKNETLQKAFQSIIDRQIAGAKTLAQAYERISSLQEKHKNITESILSTEEKIKQIKQEQRGPGVGPFSGADVDFMQRAFQGGIGRGLAGVGRVLGRNPQALFGAIGAIGTATVTGGELYKQIATQPERTAKEEAKFARMMSEQGRLQLEGRGYEMMYYGPERARAMERATEKADIEKTTDITKLIGTTMTGAAVPVIARTLLGALGGGLGGVMLGGVGAIPGAIMGAKTGFASSGMQALGGAALSFGGQMMNERTRNMLFDRDAYEKKIGGMLAQTYEEQKAAEIAKSPEKYLAQQFFERESGRFRKLQRKFGLSDEELFLGPQSIFSRATGAGYGMDTMTRAMEGISAAGGTTKVATQGAQTAAQLERNLNLTNAGSLIGRISGGTGMNAIQSKDEIIRMYAEGTRIGLDTSEVREYMQTAADIGYKTGGDLDVISNLLSAGVQGTGLTSTRGIEAAQSALERIRQETGERGGLTGQYKFAAYSKMGIKDLGAMSYLAGLPIEQLTEEDSTVKAILEKANKGRKEEEKITIDQLIKETVKSTFRTSGVESAGQEYYKAIKETEKTKKGSEEYKIAKEKEDKAQAEYEMKLSIEKQLPTDRSQRRAYSRQLAIGQEGTTEEAALARKEYEDKYKQQAEIEPGKMTDKQEKALAAGTNALLSNLRRIESGTESLSKAFEEYANLPEKARNTQAGLAAFEEAISGLNKESLQNLKEFINTFNKNKQNSDQNTDNKTTYVGTKNYGN